MELQSNREVQLNQYNTGVRRLQPKKYTVGIVRYKIFWQYLKPIYQPYMSAISIHYISCNIVNNTNIPLVSPFTTECIHQLHNLHHLIQNDFFCWFNCHNDSNRTIVDKRRLCALDKKSKNISNDITHKEI